MNVAIAQIAPVFMNRQATTDKTVDWIARAAAEGAQLVTFGETVLPAYPVWLSRTDGARFDSDDQKRFHALYLSEAVVPEAGHLDPIRSAARAGKIAVVIGVAERPQTPGGHSIYCSRVFISAAGEVLSIHRKLMPTYEERLAWALGDGAGLVTHAVGEFTVGALNCWENWMPLARAALYEAGENLHVALWPGCARLTRDVTRFLAQEGRSFVLSASALIREDDLPPGFPMRDRVASAGEVLYDGGSCIAGPDGRWIVEPVTGQESLITAELDMERVLGERQNFDPAGHYARPDVLRLNVDRTRRGS